MSSTLTTTLYCRHLLESFSVHGYPPTLYGNPPSPLFYIPLGTYYLLLTLPWSLLLYYYHTTTIVLYLYDVPGSPPVTTFAEPALPSFLAALSHPPSSTLAAVPRAMAF